MNACGVARASAAESAGVGAETGSGFEEPHAYASSTAAGMSSRMPALRQRDVLLDHQVRRQSLDLEPGPRLEGFGAFELSRAHRRVDALRQDRKSTRLNSSHSQISYAVFCLK